MTEGANGSRIKRNVIRSHGGNHLCGDKCWCWCWCWGESAALRGVSSVERQKLPCLFHFLSNPLAASPLKFLAPSPTLPYFTLFYLTQVPYLILPSNRTSTQNLFLCLSFFCSCSYLARITAKHNLHTLALHSLHIVSCTTHPLLTGNPHPRLGHRHCSHHTNHSATTASQQLHWNLASHLPYRPLVLVRTEESRITSDTGFLQCWERCRGSVSLPH